MTIEERAYWLGWSRVPGIGPVSMKRINERFGGLKQAWNAPLSALGEVDGLGKKTIEAIEAARSRLNPQQLLEQHQQNQWDFWTPIDPDYPKLLLEIPNHPPILYYRGQVNLEENQGIKPIVGIVGTREPSDYGRRWTKTIGSTLAKHNFTIVSGLALGIDGYAHQSCLEAGGRTIAVLGTGIDVVYPRSHQNLYDRIQEQGLILTDYPPGTQPEGKNFPPRNRIIAGLSRAVLVMEAKQRSGALITARYANEFGRDVYTLPGSLDNPQSLGCLELCNQGAHLILGTGSLLSQLGEIPQLEIIETPAPVKPLPNLAPPLQQVLEVLTTEALPLDLIIHYSGLTAPELSGTLLELELMGLVKQLPGMRYQRI